MQLEVSSGLFERLRNERAKSLISLNYMRFSIVLLRSSSELGGVVSEYLQKMLPDSGKLEADFEDHYMLTESLETREEPSNNLS
jgi:hypothetical protein